ncbi:MAG TPA: DUF6602 domain-containing protein [Thermoanaerobaculia bacterium]
MMTWSLPHILHNLHKDISSRLAISNDVGHGVVMGDASERVWLGMLQKYLPARYRAERAHVVDSDGKFSQQIDIVVFDRQYSPFIFDFEDQKVVPAESVYAVFEAKQTIDARNVLAAQEKAASVRCLHRTSLPIPHAGGVYPAKTPARILAGILTLKSGWSPELGDTMLEALSKGSDDRRLELGCVAAHGAFSCDEQGCYSISHSDKAATEFLFELIARLQMVATVPMIDVRAYARWLEGREHA